MLTLCHVITQIKISHLRFFDPHKSGENHLGFHPRNIKAFAQSRCFKPFLFGALGKLDEAAHNIRQQDQFSWRPEYHSDPRIVCVTYCNKGRHRSISAFSILREVLQREFRVNVYGTHLNCSQSRAHIKHLLHQNCNVSSTALEATSW